MTFSFDLETEPDCAKERENMLRTRDIGMTDVWVDGRRTDRYRVPAERALINNALLQGCK